jgi:RimJ/RimL family protein N-acetyltransferase
MNIRPTTESDIEQVIQLFRLNYGDDYPIPEFYDPQWVKRGIYSDHIIWMVIEDLVPGEAAPRIVASAAAILDFGDYNDQIAEIGRLVVDPGVGGKGLGRQILTALVDASDDRVEFAFGEARTTHVKTQRIFDRVGLMPVGFMPMSYRIQWRESWVLSGQLFNNGRALRQPESVQIIPEAAAVAELALRNLDLTPVFTVRDDARPYPFDHSLRIEPITGASMIRLLKIEQGRTFNPEVFGGLHLDQGVSLIQARKASYLVASDGAETLGAVGLMPDPTNRNVRIVELVAREDAVKGRLLQLAVEEAETVHEAELIECDVSAHNPRVQRTLLDLGFLPAAYIPGMVFHNTARWDVVRMVKLNAVWEPGPLEFTEAGQAMFDVVTPPFIRQSEQRLRRQPVRAADAFRCLSPLEMDLLQRAGSLLDLPAGSALALDGLCVVLSGAVRQGERLYGAGSTLGAVALLQRSAAREVTAVEPTGLFSLPLAAFDALCARHPQLGLTLYRCLADSFRAEAG